jgi:hypothetical protein
MSEWKDISSAPREERLITEHEGIDGAYETVTILHGCNWYAPGPDPKRPFVGGYYLPVSAWPKRWRPAPVAGDAS